MLLATEVGRNFSPLLCFPLYNGRGYTVGAQPLFCPCYDIVQPGGRFVMLQGGFTLLFVHPQDGIIRVAVDYLVFNALLFHQCQRMDNCQKLANVVRSRRRTEMKDALPRSKVDALVLHWSRISRTRSIYRPRICLYTQGQRQHGVVSVLRWVL